MGAGSEGQGVHGGNDRRPDDPPPRSLSAAIETAAEEFAAIEWYDLGTVLRLRQAFADVAALARLSTGWCAAAAEGACRFLDRFLELSGPPPVTAAGALLSDLIARLAAVADQRVEDGPSVVPPGLADHVTAPPSAPGLTLPVETGQVIDEGLLFEFAERVRQVATEIEQIVLTFQTPASGNDSRALAGLLHTLKGEAGALGIADVERFAHAAEDVLAVGPDAEGLGDGLLAAVDWLRAVAEKLIPAGRPLPAMPERLRRFLAEASAKTSVEQEHLPTDAVHHEERAGLELSRDPQEVAEFLHEVTDHLESADQQLLVQESGNEASESLNSLFRSFHTIKWLSGFFGCLEVHRIAHETETLLGAARAKQVTLRGKALDLVFNAVDLIREEIARLKAYAEKGLQIPSHADASGFARRVQAVLVITPTDGPDDAEIPVLQADALAAHLIATGAISREALTSTLAKDAARGKDATAVAKALIDSGLVSAGAMARAMHQARAQTQGRQASVRETVKVDAERLDRLVDCIGELVIAQSMVAQATEIGAAGRLAGRMAQVDKLTRELQEMATSLRMVPVKATFQRMARLVRDTAKKLGKELALAFSGEDTELDKTVVDKLGDPLVHLVRNAVDHGLEARAADRLACGKSAAGTVRLAAFHKGGSIYIEVRDDGRGLDRQRILAKARQQRLIADGQELSDREVQQLLFLPGFSTAQEVTDVSGRGVGLDVVKRSVEALRGQVDVASAPGQGTCFSLRLPLTLAVIDGMVVKVGPERYIVPTLSIISSLRPRRDDLTTAVGRAEMLLWQGHPIPLYRLGRIFGVPGTCQDPTQGLAVVVDDEGRHVAILVDDLLGQQQVVIKSLGAAFRNLPGISGGAIMPDGTIGLIIDCVGLMRAAEQAYPARNPSSTQPATALAAVSQGGDP